MPGVFIFNLVIFLAGFLLFQIELIIAKVYLPNFGGSYLVWGACMVFFQAALVSGYLFSHGVLQKFGISRYRYFHILLICLPLLTFPGQPLTLVFRPTGAPLVFEVFWRLLLTIGPVFFVLSTTSVVLQSWLAASNLKEKTNPYSLYAMSNMGSFAGLLTYPFFFEMVFDLNTQLAIWRGAYGLFLIGHILIVWVVQTKPMTNESTGKKAPLNPKDLWLWFLFGAVGVMLFLSVTNIITYEVTPFPLLWIIPLGIYLLSWTLNFKQNPWCPAWVNNNIHLTVGFGILLFFTSYTLLIPFLFYLIFYCIVLFGACMCCQNQLYQSRPADDKQLTAFYAMISLGGFAGGVVVNWIIPVVLNNMLEFLISLFVLTLTLRLNTKTHEKISWSDIRFMIYPVALMALWPRVFVEYHFFGVAIIVVATRLIFMRFQKKMTALSLSVLLFICSAFFLEPLWFRAFCLYQQRNYYGIYKVFNENGLRYLMHGQIIQGAQYLKKEKQTEPILYYHPTTTVGEFFRAKDFDFKDIAIVGLGAGALAATIHEGQNLDFFEIDKDIHSIASKYFTFLDQSPSNKRFIFGDGRLMLSQMTGKSYDLIILDVFSGDSIPVHMLTIEAIEEYRKHLNPGGVILFHVTNRYISTAPIVITNARLRQAYVCYKANQGFSNVILPTEWLAVTWDRDCADVLVKKQNWKIPAIRQIPPWTDQYSNVLSIVKIDNLINRVKDFKPFSW